MHKYKLIILLYKETKKQKPMDVCMDKKSIKYKKLLF